MASWIGLTIGRAQYGDIPGLQHAETHSRLARRLRLALRDHPHCREPEASIFSPRALSPPPPAWDSAGGGTQNDGGKGRRKGCVGVWGSARAVSWTVPRARSNRVNQLRQTWAWAVTLSGGSASVARRPGGAVAHALTVACASGVYARLLHCVVSRGCEGWFACVCVWVSDISQVCESVSHVTRGVCTPLVPTLLGTGF
eukprot:COSAG01_NODE_3850_length_5633_cov_17.214453_2_plen_199_part_00